MSLKKNKVFLKMKSIPENVFILINERNSESNK